MKIVSEQARVARKLGVFVCSTLLATGSMFGAKVAIAETQITQSSFTSFERLDNPSWQSVPGASVGRHPAETLMDVNGIARNGDSITFDVTGYRGFYYRLEGNCNTQQVQVIRQGISAGLAEFRYRSVDDTASGTTGDWHLKLLNFACSTSISTQILQSGQQMISSISELGISGSDSVSEVNGKTVHFTIHLNSQNAIETNSINYRSFSNPLTGISHTDKSSREISLNETEISQADSCSLALSEAQNDIESVNGADVERSQTREHGYENYPSDRPLALEYWLKGQGAIDIMNSPVFLSSIATEIITACESVGVVVFGVFRTDWARLYGLIDNNIQEFECLGGERRGNRFVFIDQQGNVFNQLPWGYHRCL